MFDMKTNTLFEDGDWRLVGGIMSGGMAALMHRCSKDSSLDYWRLAYNSLCGACSAEAPDELIGLKALQDWER